jgi:predicted RNase H-like HicB family nuclease
MRYAYPACFYKEEDGRYSVEIPDFSIATFGSDLADALFMAADAIAGRVHLAIREGEPIPPPSGINPNPRADGFTLFLSLWNVSRYEFTRRNRN